MRSSSAVSRNILSSVIYPNAVPRNVLSAFTSAIAANLQGCHAGK